jgi:integrase
MNDPSVDLWATDEVHFQQYGSRCRNCGKWSLHTFRHTFAATNLEASVSIRRPQRWLGHRGLESTMIYVKFVQRKDS